MHKVGQVLLQALIRLVLFNTFIKKQLEKTFRAMRVSSGMQEKPFHNLT